MTNQAVVPCSATDAPKPARVGPGEACARIGVCLALVALFFVLGFLLFGLTAYDWMMRPVQRACEVSGVDYSQMMVTRRPTEMLTARAYVALLMACGLVLPVLVQQLAFVIAPRRVVGDAAASVMVFAIGAALFVLGVLCVHGLALEPAVRAFLTRGAPAGVMILWRAADVLRFEAKVMLVGGLLFEAPFLGILVMRNAAETRKSS